MNNTQNTNNVKPKFNEYQAYEELRFIFVMAIETQNFSTIEARISAWEKKYPLDEFTDTEIIRKIKAILNRDFLSRLIGDYLAAKILHEEEKQRKAYDSLKSIIDTAKKSKDYKTAQKEIRKWKDNLHSDGFNLYDFNRLYRARVCTLLLLPSREIANQEKATDELKKIKENGASMNHKDYFEAISNWQNTYSISDFPDKLKKELNQITTEVFDSISQKRTSENALLEIENVLSSKDIPLPADAISSILSKYDYRNFDRETISRIRDLNMEALSIQESDFDNVVTNLDLSVISNVSPTEAGALASLVDILNKTPHDMDTILNWIYVNRKISYSEFAREKIVEQFSSVGYKIPDQSSYSIPDINTNLGYEDFSMVDDLRKNVILNYLGIISQGKKLSDSGKDRLIDAHLFSSTEELAKDDAKPIMFLEAFDTVVETPEAEEEKSYNEESEIDLDENEELIYNIFIEDIIDDPLETYSISPAGKENTTTTTTTTENEIDSDCEYLLTVQDEENLEQAHELSTYVEVATPILDEAFEPRLQRVRGLEKI